MIYILVAINIATIAFCVWLLRKHFDLLDKFDDLNERIENCLDTIEVSHKKLTTLLKTPVLFDDPVVVEIVQTTKTARNALMTTLNRLIPENEEE